MSQLKKTNIIINGRFLSQKITGVQRFAYELTKSLIAGGLNITVLAPKNINKDYHLDCKIIQWGYIKGPLWEQVDLLFYLKTHGNPLLINFSGLGPILYKNQVCTIHDLAFFVHPEWFSSLFCRLYRYFTPILARNSKKIITVSNFSKNEIIRILGIKPEKIWIVNNAVDFSKIQPIRPEKLSSNPYILSVGSMDPRKNLKKLIEAYNKSGIYDKYELVLVGKNDPIFNVTDSPEINQKCIGYVSDEELVYLYKNASLFVYPSLYEGFGIPPLEAMSQGCPVVLSDIPVFREIFYDAACFVNPNDTTNIKDGILNVISDENKRAEMINKGFETFSHYSWEKSADLLIELIEKL